MRLILRACGYGLRDGQIGEKISDLGFPVTIQSLIAQVTNEADDPSNVRCFGALGMVQRPQASTHALDDLWLVGIELACVPFPRNESFVGDVWFTNCFWVGREFFTSSDFIQGFSDLGEVDFRVSCDGVLVDF